jgi:mitochondrial import inner membrane translocase subunit TIM21
MFQDVFSPNSKTSYFNRAVSKVKNSDACVAALGPANKMTFYGESVRSSFRRARINEPTPISRSTKDEGTGIEELRMQFLVKGEKAEGWVTMHLEKQPDELEFQWVLLALDIKGHHRIYLEGSDPGVFKKGSTRMFGVKWR